MKKNLNKTMAMAMALTIVGSTAAYAATTTKMEKLEKAQEVTAEKQEAEEKSTETAEKETAIAATVSVSYITQSGKVMGVEDTEDGNKVVTIENKDGGLRFVVAPTTVIVDSVSKDVITVDKLTKDMQVSVVYDANSPVGMSMPPYLGNVAAVVANADKGNVSVGVFNDELVNEAEKLQLNVEKETKVLTTLGTKSILGAEDIKGKHAVVFYGATTKSIPAQTTPDLVLLLEQQDVQPVEEVKDAKVVAEPEAKEVKSVALREGAVAKGYTVTWKGKTEPVVLEKDGKVSKITLGSKDYVIEEDMVLTASMAAELKDGVLYVSSEVMDNLK